MFIYIQVVLYIEIGMIAFNFHILHMNKYAADLEECYLIYVP